MEGIDGMNFTFSKSCRSSPSCSPIQYPIDSATKLFASIREIRGSFRSSKIEDLFKNLAGIEQQLGVEGLLRQFE